MSDSYPMTKNGFESRLDRVQAIVDTTKYFAGRFARADLADLAEDAKEVALDAINYKKRGGLNWVSIGPVNASWSFKKTSPKIKEVEDAGQAETIKIEGAFAERFNRTLKRAI